MKKFSCLLSCFYKDNPIFLEDCLNSIVNQTLKPTEVVLVEDGPIGEELSSIINKYGEILEMKRIKLEENQGLGSALKIGLENCTYDIVCRMDADDICFSNRFELQVDHLLKNPKIDILGGWVKDIDQEGNIIGERRYPVTNQKIRKLIWSNPIIHPVVAYRKKSIVRIGSYNTELKRRQDYDLWLRAAKSDLVFENLPVFLLLYRFTPNYYKKNNSSVAYDQVKMAWTGMKGNRDVSVVAYIMVLVPLLRSLLPPFIIKYVHKLMNKLDPRRQ